MTSGTTMLTMAVPQQRRVTATCDSCPFGQCKFRRAAVYFYLKVWERARSIREPFEVVFDDETQAASISDPAIRGGRGQGDYAQLIRLSLERARDEGHIPLVTWNTDKIAAFCCPDRHDEGE